jgi:membrane protein YqaA with SNARE-associated domain
VAEPIIERKELEALLFNVADMAQVLGSFMNSFFGRIRMTRKKRTKAEVEEHKAFREQMQRNIDGTRELASQMRAEREAREREQQAS